MKTFLTLLALTASLASAHADVKTQASFALKNTGYKSDSAVSVFVISNRGALVGLQRGQLPETLAVHGSATGLSVASDGTVEVPSFTYAPKVLGSFGAFNASTLVVLVHAPLGQGEQAFIRNASKKCPSVPSVPAELSYDPNVSCANDVPSTFLPKDVKFIPLSGLGTLVQRAGDAVDYSTDLSPKN